MTAFEEAEAQMAALATRWHSEAEVLRAAGDFNTASLLDACADAIGSELSDPGFFAIGRAAAVQEEPDRPASQDEIVLSCNCSLDQWTRHECEAALRDPEAWNGGGT